MVATEHSVQLQGMIIMHDIDQILYIIAFTLTHNQAAASFRHIVLHTCQVRTAVPQTHVWAKEEEKIAYLSKCIHNKRVSRHASQPYAPRRGVRHLSCHQRGPPDPQEAPCSPPAGCSAMSDGSRHAACCCLHSASEQEVDMNQGVIAWRGRNL